MVMDTDSQEYTLIVFHETPKALLVGVEINDKKKNMWLPKSQIEIGVERAKVGQYQCFDITVPDWLAEKVGIA
jgi:hypothetical protein